MTDFNNNDLNNAMAELSKLVEMDKKGLLNNATKKYNAHYENRSGLSHDEFTARKNASRYSYR